MSFTSPGDGAPVDAAPGDPAPAPGRWRDVHLAAAARGTSYAGDLLAATALVLALQSRGYGGWSVAALLLAATVPPVVLVPVTGRLVDRVDSRPLLVAVGLAQAATCVLMAYLAQPALWVALSALLAAGLAVTQPTFGALTAEMVDRAELPRAMAIGQTATSIGMLIGPALAGMLVGQFGIRLPLLLDGASYVAIAIAGLLIKTRRRGGVATVPLAGAAPVPSAGSWSMRQDTLLTSLVLLFATAVAAVSLINVVDVFFVRGTLGASPGMYGLLFAVWTGAMMIGAWLFARFQADDGGYALILVGLLTLTCLAVAATGLAPTVGWVMALFVLGGTANGGENTVAGVLVARRVPAPFRGRGMARVGAAMSASNVIGYLAGGALLAVFSPRTLLAGAGLGGLAVVLALSVPVWRAVRRERRCAVAHPEQVRSAAASA